MGKKNNIINKIWAFLNQPFPEETDVFSVLKQGALVGLFIFFFLKFIQPFDFHNAGNKVTLYSIYFGLSTFVVIILYDTIMIYLLKLKRNLPNWTFIKWIFSVIGLLFFISLSNFYVMIIINEIGSFSWSYLLKSFYVTTIVGVFPTVFFGALKLNRRKAINERIAENINSVAAVKTKDDDVINIVFNNDKTVIKRSDFLYAQSMQNYVTIFYKNANGAVEKNVIRSTLTALANQIKSDQILQVHRSYIVNKSMVDKVTGNAQGLKLYINDSDSIVPVSRKYISLFR